MKYPSQKNTQIPQTQFNNCLSIAWDKYLKSHVQKRAIQSIAK